MMGTENLSEKIHHARSLDGIPHETKLVDYKNLEELVKTQVKNSPSDSYLIYHFAKDFQAKAITEFFKENFSYQTFYDKVSQTINLLQNQGLKKGDRIATASHNHSDTVIQYFAAWIMGLVVVPINVNEDTERINYILDYASVKLLFVRDLYLEKFSEIAQNIEKLKTIVACKEHNHIHTKSCQLQSEKGFEDNKKTICPPSEIIYFHSINNLSKEYRLKEDVGLDDEALIVFTSGTTGNPKAVVLTQYNLMVDAKNISEWHNTKAQILTHSEAFKPERAEFTMCVNEHREGESNEAMNQKRGFCMMCVLPIHHVNGIIVTLITPMYFGGTVVLNDKFRTNTFFKTIAEEKINVVSVVPTLLAFLLEGDKDLISKANPNLDPASIDFAKNKYKSELSKNLDLSAFHHIICGAGPLTVELALEFEKHFGIRIVHGYGLSETTCYSCFLPIDLKEDEHKKWMQDFGFPSIGQEIPANKMDIHDDHGNSVSEGERGEIVIRGHNVMVGYYQNPQANEETYKHGWFRSGDEGFYQLDKNGNKYFFITGRLKELIIRGGVNISPLEIDEVIMSIPGVKAGISVGFENNMYGEEVGAYVELGEKASLSDEDIINHCKSKLPFHKCPKVVVFGNEIPVTSTGKYQRNKLKPLFAKYKNIQFKK